MRFRTIALATTALLLTAGCARAQIFGGGGGTSGVGIAGTAVNGAGHLIITRTDGSTLDAGLVVGPAGLGVMSATVNGAGHLILTRTDGSTLDAGLLPGGTGGAVTYGTTAGTAAQGNDSRIVGALQATDAAATYATKAALAALSSGGSYTLPQASASTLGGVKLGSTMTINPVTGVVDVVTTSPTNWTGAIPDNVLIPGLVPTTVNGTTTYTPYNFSLAQMSAKIVQTAPVYATTYTSTLSASSVSSGSSVTYALTPTTNGWPSGLTITPSTTVSGATVSPASITPTAGSATPAVFTVVTNGTGSGTVTSSTSPSMTNTSGALALTVTAYVAPGPTLTMASATYGTGNSGQGLTGGTGTGAFTLAANSDYTIEFWAKLSSTASGSLVIGPDNTGSGTATGLRAVGDGTVLPSLRGYDQGKSAVLSDGAFHHFALSVSPSAGTYSFHADGVVVFSGSNNGAVGSMPANPAIKVAVPSGITLDQMRISSTARYSAAFTPATILGKDASTLGLYQFEGNGAAQ